MKMMYTWAVRRCCRESDAQRCFGLTVTGRRGRLSYAKDGWAHGWAAAGWWCGTLGGHSCGLPGRCG